MRLLVGQPPVWTKKENVNCNSSRTTMTLRNNEVEEEDEKVDKKAATNNRACLNWWYIARVKFQCIVLSVLSLSLLTIHDYFSSGIIFIRGPSQQQPQQQDKTKQTWTPQIIMNQQQTNPTSLLKKETTIMTTWPGNRTITWPQKTSNVSFRASVLSSSSSSSSSLVSSSSPSPLFATIIGAGAAGLSAGLRLQQHGIANFVILEAAHQIGGRVRKDLTFLNHPLDVGATVVGQPNIVNTMAHYNFTYIQIPGGQLAFSSNFTWYDYFVQYILPQVQPQQQQQEETQKGSSRVENATRGRRRRRRPASKIVYGCQVNAVQYTGRDVEVSCSGGHYSKFYSKYVIVTVPLQVLKDGDIAFTPPLPPKLVQGHPGVMWQGMKVFVTFSKRWFEGELFCLVECPGETNLGGSYFWDYTPVVPNHNLLAGLLMGRPYQHFEHMTEDQIIVQLLHLMSIKFDLPISDYYVDHFVFNWTDQPFVRGTYTSEGIMGPRMINDKVLLAGEAYPVNLEQNGWVHGAMNSGLESVQLMLEMERKRKTHT